MKTNQPLFTDVKFCTVLTWRLCIDKALNLNALMHMWTERCFNAFMNRRRVSSQEFVEYSLRLFAALFL